MFITIDEYEMMKAAISTAKKLAKEIGTEDDVSDVVKLSTWFDQQPILPNDIAPDANEFMLEWANNRRTSRRIDGFTKSDLADMEVWGHD